MFETRYTCVATGGFGGLGLAWRSRNVGILAAAGYLAPADDSSAISGRAGLRVGF